MHMFKFMFMYMCMHMYVYMYSVCSKHVVHRYYLVHMSLNTSSSRASRGRKFQKKKVVYSKERICL